MNRKTIEIMEKLASEINKTAGPEMYGRIYNLRKQMEIPLSRQGIEQERLCAAADVVCGFGLLVKGSETLLEAAKRLESVFSLSVLGFKERVLDKLNMSLSKVIQSSKIKGDCHRVLDFLEVGEPISRTHGKGTEQVYIHFVLRCTTFANPKIEPIKIKEDMLP